MWRRQATRCSRRSPTPAVPAVVAAGVHRRRRGRPARGRQHIDAALQGAAARTTCARALRSPSSTRPRSLTVEVDGDLRGRGTWTLTPITDGTHVRFDWQVHADRKLLRMLTPILRPALRANHAWAIDRAKEGLQPYAQSLAAVASATPSPRRRAGSPRSARPAPADDPARRSRCSGTRRGRCRGERRARGSGEFRHQATARPVRPGI